MHAGSMQRQSSSVTTAHGGYSRRGLFAVEIQMAIKSNKYDVVRKVIAYCHTNELLILFV